MSQAPPDHTPQSVASPWVDAQEPERDSGMRTPEARVDPGVRSASARVSTILAAAVCVASLLGYVLEHRGLRSAQSTRAAQAAALAQMKADAERIAFLQAVPRRAADRLKPNDELLAQVDAALEVAQVSRDHWNDSVPQPPERLAGADYTRWTVRLYLEDMPMQAFTRFVHALLGADPTLYLASLRIQPARRNAGGNAEATWNVEMAVAYDVYAPAITDPSPPSR